MRLFEGKHLRELVKRRWKERKDDLKVSIAIFNEYAEKIKISAEMNFMRWPVLGTPYEGLGWENLKSYYDNVDFLKDWMA